MTIPAEPVPILSDNYAWLLRDSATGAVAIVDPAEPKPIIAALEQAGGRLDLILLTHHHAHHIARPHRRPDQLLLPRRRDPAVRRYAVQPGLRPAERGQRRHDVRLVAQA